MTEKAPVRVRREPPGFRWVEVRRVAPVTPRLTRVTFWGVELSGLEVNEPAASVRLLLPQPGEDPALPVWNGNEFLRVDGTRPTIRTFTPRRLDPEALELDLEIVLHDQGAATDWVRRASPGARAAVSGTGRGYVVDPATRTLLLAGDETAIPAISQLLEQLDSGVAIHVIVEIADPSARLDLPHHPGCTLEWVRSNEVSGDALAGVVAAAPIPEDARVWVAAEAAAVQRIRRHLFEERGITRSRATVRGYWKLGRGGDGAEEI